MKVVVLGAGLAGLWLARRLLDEGFEVELIERGSSPGGLMETIIHEDFLLDMGPHILLASHLNHYKELLGEDLLRTDGYYGFGYGGRQIPSPLSPGNLIRALGLGKAVPFAASMAWSRILGPRPPWKNVDQVLAGKFGKQVNEAFFRNYIPKITGLPSSEISPDWFLERYRFYQEHSLWRKLKEKIAQNVKKRLSGQVSEAAAGLELYYPRKGAQMLTDTLYTRISEQGAVVNLQATVTGIKAQERQVDSVVYTTPDGEKRSVEGDLFVSTLPVNHLPRLFNGILGEKASIAADQLQWRHLWLYYIAVDRERVSDKIQIYFTEGKYPFKRIYEPKNLINTMGRPGETALCVELCYFEGDAIDRVDEQTNANNIVNGVCDFYGLSPEEVRFLFSRKVPHAYAVYKEGYREHLGQLATALFSVNNFLSYGRQGSFRYNHLVDRIIDASDSVMNYIPEMKNGKNVFLKKPDPKSDFF